MSKQFKDGNVSKWWIKDVEVREIDGRLVEVKLCKPSNRGRRGLTLTQPKYSSHQASQVGSRWLARYRELYLNGR